MDPNPQVKYLVEIAQRRYEIEIPAAGPESGLRINGQPCSIDIVNLPAQTGFSAIINGCSRVFNLEPDGDKITLYSTGRHFTAEVRDERQEKVRNLSAAQLRKREHTGEVRSPMPGLVVKLNVQEGDSIQRGQGVIVVEAMKMENEIPSPIDGVVQKVYVQPGQTVDKNQALLSIGVEPQI